MSDTPEQTTPEVVEPVEQEPEGPPPIEPLPAPMDFRIFARCANLKLHISKYYMQGKGEPFRVKFADSYWIDKPGSKRLVEGTADKIEEAIQLYLEYICGKYILVDINEYAEPPYRRYTMVVPVPPNLIFDPTLDDKDTPYVSYGRKIDGTDVPTAYNRYAGQHMGHAPTGFQHGHGRTPGGSGCGV